MSEPITTPPMVTINPDSKDASERSDARIQKAFILYRRALDAHRLLSTPRAARKLSSCIKQMYAAGGGTEERLQSHLTRLGLITIKDCGNGSCTSCWNDTAKTLSLIKTK